LWLFPPVWPLLSLGLLGYLNQRVFRYDALAAHADAGELSRLVRGERWSLLALGVLVALAAHVPLLGFFAPVFGGLAFIHFGLDRLRALRAEPIAGEWSRVRE
jgi:4-amino-4-deoxy-L-arabinose transferase-like glycosyltransferase